MSDDDIKERLQASQKACFDAGQHIAAMDIRDALARIEALEAQLVELEHDAHRDYQALEAENGGLIAQLAAVRKALEFYRDGFRFIPKRSYSGIDLSTWEPKPELLEDCGERALSALGNAPTNPPASISHPDVPFPGFPAADVSGKDDQ